MNGSVTPGRSIISLPSSSLSLSLTIVPLAPSSSRRSFPPHFVESRGAQYTSLIYPPRKEREREGIFRAIRASANSSSSSAAASAARSPRCTCRPNVTETDGSTRELRDVLLPPLYHTAAAAAAAAAAVRQKIDEWANDAQRACDGDRDECVACVGGRWFYFRDCLPEWSFRYI